MDILQVKTSIKEKIDSYLDLSPLYFEVMTGIPMEKLVNIICDFDWNDRYNQIYLKLVKPESSPFIDYEPEFRLETGDIVKEILVSAIESNKKEKFDSIVFNFEESTSPNKTKILGHFSFGFKTWHYIYILIAVGFGFYIAGKPFISGYEATIVLLVSLVPMILISLLRVNKVKKDAIITKYKKEFEEHIRENEEEILSD